MRDKLTNRGPLPDPMPLRDALRGLRHALRRGGETFLDTIPVSALPRPAAELAGAVLREVGEIARGVNEVASGFARLALGGGGGPYGSLHDLSGRQGAEDVFAQAIYAALRAVLLRLHAPSAYVSETAARTAYLALATDQRSGTDAQMAAALSIALMDAKVLRGASADDAARVPGSALECVALFAVLLWLQSDRSDTDGEAALDAATDLAVALAPEASLAFSARDEKRLESLYAEFASHV